MKLIMTIIWGFILSHVVSYVISSMTGSPYDFQSSSIFAIVVIVAIYLIGSLSISKPTENH